MKIKISAGYKKKGLIFLIFVFSINLLFAQKSDLSYSITLENTQAFARTNEVISIPREKLSDVPAGYYPIVKSPSKTYASQLTDDDGDGQWDHLLVEISLKPHAHQTLTLVWIKGSPTPDAPLVANIRFSLKTKTTYPETEIDFLQRTRGFTQNIADPTYQMEGPGIENDKVAFRAFFDKRNSKDIYGKITDQPVLKQVGVGAPWHTLQPWGMDIFKTGNSLGAGGLAVQQNKAIYRLADADTSTYQALYRGHLKAAFLLSFKNWDIGAGKGNGSETISMTKGNYYYQDDIIVNLSPTQYLIGGIANFKIDHPVYKKHNQDFSSVSTYGPQAEGTGTQLGVALIFPAKSFVEYKTTDSTSVIPNNTYVVLKNLPRATKTIYFVACWEKTDKHFATQAGFEAYLQHTADLLANPIKVTLTNSRK